MPGPDHPLISIVSPVYGAPELVGELVHRIVAAVEAIATDFEILLVNDACPKGSWDQIRKAAAAEPRVTGLNLSRNVGQHRAITAGLDHARGEWIVVMDCDLQDRPKEIPRLFAKAMEGHHTVFGRRHERKDTLAKRAPSRAFAAFFGWLSDSRVDRTVANFSISHRIVIEGFRQYRELDRGLPMVVHMMGFRRAYIDVEHAATPLRPERLHLPQTPLLRRPQVVVAGSNKPSASPSRPAACLPPSVSVTRSSSSHTTTFSAPPSPAGPPSPCSSLSSTACSSSSSESSDSTSAKHSTKANAAPSTTSWRRQPESVAFLPPAPPPAPPPG